MGFFDDLTGKTAAEASKAAAADTYAKQQRAIEALLGYGDQYAGEFKNLAQGYQPYVEGGQNALEQLLGGLGLSGPEAGAQFTDAYRALPGYQAGLDAGTNAISNSAAARGMTNSGRTMKDLYRFGSNYEDQRSGDYLTRLAALAGSGQQATGQQIGTVGTGLQGQLGTRTTGYGGQMQAAGTIGQGDIAAANAKSAGAQGLLNAGLQLGGMALGGFGGGGLGSLLGGFSSSFQGNPWGAQSGNVPTFY